MLKDSEERGISSSLLSFAGLYPDHLQHKQKQVFVESVSGTPSLKTQEAGLGHVRAVCEMTLLVCALTVYFLFSRRLR